MFIVDHLDCLALDLFEVVDNLSSLVNIDPNKNSSDSRCKDMREASVKC
jgi:hypothetical protein